MQDEPKGNGDLLEERIRGDVPGNGEAPEASHGGATKLNFRAAMAAVWRPSEATLSHK